MARTKGSKNKIKKPKVDREREPGRFIRGADQAWDRLSGHAAGRGLRLADALTQAIEEYLEARSSTRNGRKLSDQDRALLEFMEPRP